VIVIDVNLALRQLVAAQVAPPVLGIPQRGPFLQPHSVMILKVERLAVTQIILAMIGCHYLAVTHRVFAVALYPCVAVTQIIPAIGLTLLALLLGIAI
jgi:hypothetical protein